MRKEPSENESVPHGEQLCSYWREAELIDNRRSAAQRYFMMETSVKKE